MKKKYILVLTFLVLLCGQSSFGQSQGDYDGNTEAGLENQIRLIEQSCHCTVDRSTYTTTSNYFINSYKDTNGNVHSGFGFIHTPNGPDEYKVEESKDTAPATNNSSTNTGYYTVRNWIADNVDYRFPDSPYNPYPDGPWGYVTGGSGNYGTYPPSGTGISGIYNSSNPCNPYGGSWNLDLCHNSPPTPPTPGCEQTTCPSGYKKVNCECVVDNTPKEWYLDKDNDGYDAGTQKSVTSPGIGWEEGMSMGIDCDDSNPEIRECNLPTPVSVINTTICRCINPPNKSNFNNVTNVWNVLDGKEWVLYQTNCNTSAKEQNEKSLLSNTTPVGAGYQTNTFIDEKRQIQSAKTTPKIDMQKAIDIVAKNLKEGKPVMAGVMYERYYGADPKLGGTPNDNNNVATNHYVTIVGMGIDNGKPYFSYYDNFVDGYYKNGTQRSLSTLELIGTNVSENRLYYYQDSVGNYYFSDKTAKTLDGPYAPPLLLGHGFGNQYILTEIRDNF